MIHFYDSGCNISLEEFNNLLLYRFDIREEIIINYIYNINYYKSQYSLSKNKTFDYLDLYLPNGALTYRDVPIKLVWKTIEIMFPEKLGIATSNIKISKQEKLCMVCSKPNDVGINECWWCGNNPG